MVVVVGVITIGLATDFGDEPSAEPTAKSFLLDWQLGQYQAAAQLTNGAPGAVVAQLAGEIQDLNATEMFLSMGPIVQHGNTAVAHFTAQVDLTQGGHQWTYQGRFGLVSSGGSWRVDWAPSVIEPGLGPGDRLAVQTTFAPRAQVLDAEGKPLLPPSRTYMVGVYPSTLSSPSRTAAQFGQVTGLDQTQVLGQIRAAPPRAFLPLLTLDQADFQKMRPRLATVPGLHANRVLERLFNADPDDVVGQIGTENSDELRAEGAAYQPGDTVGLSGLEQTYQDSLAGTPTTTVEVVNSAGAVVDTLWTTAGSTGTPVRTTISGHYQAAASAALAGLRSSGEIIAVQPSTGHILAVAEHEAGGLPLPEGGALNARLTPGMTFTIVSAAALLSSGIGANTPVPCTDVTNVGGQTFTNDSSAASAGQPFSADFASGCGTAFATLSMRLTPGQLAAAEKDFGIGSAWDLRVQAFSGSTAVAAGAGQSAGLAAETIGQGGVRMSPLGMAMVAAEVESGVGHVPVLVASDPAATWQSALSSGALDELRGLMREAVRTGTARAADLTGEQVYGQAGVMKTGTRSWLSWFVGYRGDLAFAVLETGTSAQQAAASLAASFLAAAGTGAR
jgi:cell division protein FtsI/penicillin-binding protein 2